MKIKLAYVGRGVLNLIMVLAVVVGLRMRVSLRPGNHSAMRPVLESLTRGPLPHHLGPIAGSIVLIALYFAGARWIERRKPSELLGRAGLKEFVAGVALGLVLITTLMLFLWMAGVYHPSGWGTVAPLAGGFLGYLSVAIFEEILFRGFLFRLSASLLGTWGALAFTSVLFGAAHASNRGATVGSSLAIALEAGVLLGASYALTQRLWLPIGLHLGWNFAEGPIFGMSVSGGAIKSSLIAGTLRGSDLVTGGTFGPEASIVAVVIGLAVALPLLRRTVRLGRLEPPAWAPITTVQCGQG